jgi:hypothetical protein
LQLERLWITTAPGEPVEFLIDNIFVMIGGSVFQQTVDIPMGTNCALLADLFLYSYEADFIQGHLKKSEKKLAPSFNFHVP